MSLSYSDLLAIISTILFSFVVPLFIFDPLKSKIQAHVRDSCDDFIELFNLPSHISIYRIVRCFYILGVLFVANGLSISLPDNNISFPLLLAISASLVPTLFLLFVLFIFSIGHLFACVVDLIMFIFYVPYVIYVIYKKNTSYSCRPSKTLLYYFMMLLLLLGFSRLTYYFLFLRFM